MSGGAIFQLGEQGLNRVTMSYEDGGKIEVWNYNDIQVRVPAMTPQDDVKRMLLEKAAKS